MKCPYCGKDATKVIDSRPSEDNTTVRRRRKCEHCGKRFTTYEKIETIPLVVIKKDNTRQQYDRSKIEQGVMRACYKRAVPIADIQAMVDRVEAEIYNRGTGEIKSSEIGEMIIEELKDLDPVAYVRFASVYREFKDVGTFMEELKKIIK